MNTRMIEWPSTLRRISVDFEIYLSGLDLLELSCVQHVSVEVLAMKNMKRLDMGYVRDDNATISMTEVFAITHAMPQLEFLRYLQ